MQFNGPIELKHEKLNKTEWSISIINLITLLDQQWIYINIQEFHLDTATWAQVYSTEYSTRSKTLFG